MRLLAEMLQTHMNLEMAATDEMLRIACEVRPSHCCLVPERREELTTEGGLDAASQIDSLRDYCAQLAEVGIQVSLFIDADERQLEAAAEIGVPVIEIHTGHYAEECQPERKQVELAHIAHAAFHGQRMGLQVNAGHGLDYHNVQAVAVIPELVEFNIGHAIVARAIFHGMAEAVREMKHLIDGTGAD